MCANGWLKEEYSLLAGCAKGEGNVTLAPTRHFDIRLRCGKCDYIFLCILIDKRLVSLLCKLWFAFRLLTGFHALQRTQRDTSLCLIIKILLLKEIHVGYA